MTETIGHPHGMNATVLYGPVPSRRYGLTLGINFFSDDCKVCTFRCPYCQLIASIKNSPLNLVTLSQLEEAFLKIPNFFVGTNSPDVIVVSGNGEPTLYPNFQAALDILRRIIKSMPTQPQIVVLTNGTRLSDSGVALALCAVDEIALKLDPNPFSANRPVEAYDALSVARAARAYSNVVIQACLYEEQIAGLSDLEMWQECVVMARPRRVDLYTLARQTVAHGLKPVTEKFMREVAGRLAEVYKGPIRIFA